MYTCIQTAAAVHEVERCTLRSPTKARWTIRAGISPSLFSNSAKGQGKKRGAGARVERVQPQARGVGESGREATLPWTAHGLSCWLSLSLSLSLYLSLLLPPSTYLHLYLTTYSSINLSSYRSTNLSVNLPIYFCLSLVGYLHTYVYMYVYNIYIYIYIYIYMSICLSAYSIGICQYVCNTKTQYKALCFGFTMLSKHHAPRASESLDSFATPSPDSPDLVKSVSTLALSEKA